MYRLGSLIAIFSGVFEILAGSLMLGYAGDIDIQKISGTGRDTYSIFIILFGVITFIFGFFAWKNPKGFSSFVLLLVFTANVVLLVINGWSNGNAIASLIINSIGSVTILLGMLISKKQNNQKNKIA